VTAPRFRSRPAGHPGGAEAPASRARSGGAGPLPGIIRRLIGLLAPHRRRLLWAFALMLVTTAGALARPRLMQLGIDDGIRAGDLGMLQLAVAAFLVAAVVGEGAGGWQRYELIRVGVRVITDLRTRMFGHLLALPQSYHDRNRPGDLMSRVSADAETLSDFVTWSVISSVQNILTLGGIVWILVATDATLAATTFLVLPLMVLATRRWLRATKERYSAMRIAVGDVSATAEESLAGIRVVKALGQERHTVRRFGRANRHQRDTDLGTDKVSSAFYPVIDLLSDGAIAVVLGFGGLRVLSGDLQPGELVAFLLYVGQFFDPIRDLTTRLDSVQDARAAGERIFEVLDSEVTIRDRADAVELPPVTGHVRLESVTFGYTPDRPVLHDVDLDIPAGTTVALVGQTGAGKTTVGRLVGRFYEVEEGRVTIDGHDIRAVTLASLRRQIAWVPQEVGLFRGTVLDNLRFGVPDASREQVEDAARAVGAHEVFTGLPEGYDTRLDEGGGGLSGGHRQLVAFTRALLTDPAVVILDEATASVDVETEQRMQAGLGRLLAGRTAIVIAHRLSTVTGADLICVVDDGRIVAQGTHTELLDAGGRYADLYAAQLEAQTSA
jgi:ABC-type multidrug transport system fused ATPase/permease subunit